MKNARILLVEDNIETQMVVQHIFEKICHVSTASSLAEADGFLANANYDLLLLDVSLPDGDGFRYLAKLKNTANHADLPVVFLTGQQNSDDKVHGFTLGAEDYITKPFDHRELKLRVAARLRLHQAKGNEAQVKLGNLQLDLNMQQAFIVNQAGENPINLSPIEFKLLRCFIKNKDAVLSRAQLIDAVWGSHVHVLDRTIDAHVSRLRKKISDSQFTIRTNYGSGYSLYANSDARKKAA